MWLSNKTYLLFVISLALASCSTAQNSPQDYVNAHNAARAQVGVGPMTWDNTLANYAQNYANSRRDCILMHSGGPYGENIAAGGDGSFSGVQAVSLWVNEKQYYHHDSNSCSAPPGQSCGHYTQVVWRSSTSLGCGRVPCNNGGYFYICSYSPRGNIIGQSPY